MALQLPLFRDEPETNLFSGWTVNPPADADPGSTPLFDGGLMLRNQLFVRETSFYRIFVVPTNVFRQSLEGHIVNPGTGEEVQLWLSGIQAPGGPIIESPTQRIHLRYKVSKIPPVLIGEWSPGYGSA